MKKYRFSCSLPYFIENYPHIEKYKKKRTLQSFTDYKVKYFTFYIRVLFKDCKRRYTIKNKFRYEKRFLYFDR